MFNLSKFRERLIEAMAFANMSSIQLAEHIAVSVQTVNHWKRGKKSLRLSNLIKAAKALNCTIDYLIGRDNSIL